MNRVFAAALAVVVVLASIGTGVTVWLLSRDHPPQRPEISAYSRGNLARVGPYSYCEVLNLNACQTSQTQGELKVNERDPVQLSVPTAISRAPWRLLRVYSDPADTTVSVFRPDTRLAVTIPTVDPQRGRLTGVVVQLLTLVLDQAGELQDVPHAEWSVRTVWS
jgi:hypothetical protein